MSLNNIQEFLLQEFLDDRLLPCIKGILEKCTGDESTTVCIDLIFTAVEGSMNHEIYSKLIEKYQGIPEWVCLRLLSLNRLFQPENNNHLFIKPLIDTRFYSQTTSSSLDQWIIDCKKLITMKYAEEIHKLITLLSPKNDQYVLEDLKEKTDPLEKLSHRP